MPAQASIFLCPVRTETRLWLCGRDGEGGEAALTRDEQTVCFSVSPVLFDLLAIFIGKAHAVESARDWVPTGFLTGEELCRELTRRGGGDPRQPWYDTKAVVRAIYRLRLLIAGALGPGPEVDAWVKQFVENHPKLGWRLSTLPAHLELEVLPGLHKENSA